MLNAKARDSHLRESAIDVSQASTSQRALFPVYAHLSGLRQLCVRLESRGAHSRFRVFRALANPTREGSINRGNDGVWFCGDCTKLFLGKCCNGSRRVEKVMWCGMLIVELLVEISHWIFSEYAVEMNWCHCYEVRLIFINARRFPGILL